MNALIRSSIATVLTLASITAFAVTQGEADTTIAGANTTKAAADTAKTQASSVYIDMGSANTTYLSIVENSEDFGVIMQAAMIWMQIDGYRSSANAKMTAGDTAYNSGVTALASAMSKYATGDYDGAAAMAFEEAKADRDSGVSALAALKALLP